MQPQPAQTVNGSRRARSPAVLRHRRHAALRAAGAHKAEALVLHIAPHCQACSNSDCKACGAAEGASRARQGLSWAAAALQAGTLAPWRRGEAAELLNSPWHPSRGEGTALTAC